MLDVWPEQDRGASLKNVRAFSGISGGSWFLTQIGYSENFVDGADLSTLLAGWGGSQSGDITGDGVVDGAYLTALLGDWGECDL